MTTALLLLLVLILLGAPLWMGLARPLGFVGRLLQRTSPEQVRAGLEENDELYRFARKSFEKASQTGKTAAQVDPAASAEIAALNVFVEKTQIQLRQRALWCGAGAAVCVLMDVTVALVTLIWLSSPAAGVAATWAAVVLWALHAMILAGLSFTLIYVFTTLARRLFAEASAALEKRHSVGFGRLYVQMKVLAAPDPRRATRGLTETELLRAFGWNAPAALQAAEAAPIRTLALPTRGIATVRTLGPVRTGEETEPPPMP